MVEVSCFSTTTADAINTAKPYRAACDSCLRKYWLLIKYQRYSKKFKMYKT